MHPTRQSLTAPGFLGEPGRFRARQRLVAPVPSGPPPAFAVDFINEVDDDGFCIGGVQAVPSGGVAPYTYLWVDDAASQGDQYTDTLANACGPSDWTLTVTDDIGQVVVVPWHVYRAAYEATLVEASDAFNFRPVDTDQTNVIPGLAKFDSSLGTLLGVTFGYSDGIQDTNFTFDPDIRTTNTAGVTRTIRTEFDQTAEFRWDATILKTMAFSKDASNTILAGAFALPNNTGTETFGVGEIPEDTNPATLAAVTGVGDITDLDLRSYTPAVALVVTSGPASPVPTWAYQTSAPQPRPQIFGVVYVRYRYEVPRQ